MKVRSAGAELLHADEQTDVWTERQTDRQTYDEPNSRSSQICEYSN